VEAGQFFASFFNLQICSNSIGAFANEDIRYLTTISDVLFEMFKHRSWMI